MGEEHGGGSPVIRRRSFLTLLTGSALVWPRLIDALAQEVGSGGEPQDEAFWEFVRQQFRIPSGRIYLNNGTLGPPPRVVTDAVQEHALRVAQTFPPGVDWELLKGKLSHFLGGDPEGFVLPRNTTEGSSFVANGLELEEGQEIVTTDHEHIGGLSAWELAAARTGALLVRVSLPVPARSADELYHAIVSRFSPATRVLALSHITFTTGTVLPVTRLAEVCRERGIVFVVDGAHPPGMFPVDLSTLGGDFYASSPHKWLLAPQGTGLLYLGEAWRTRLWPTLASGGWDDLSLGAHRFNHMGTFDESRLAGLLAAIEFQEVIGRDRIEARIRYLHSELKRELADVPGVQVVSPQDVSLSSGMISFRMHGVDSLSLQRYLARSANIRTRVIGEYDYGWMRLSTHIYNTRSDLERVMGLIRGVSVDGLPSM